MRPATAESQGHWIWHERCTDVGVMHPFGPARKHRHFTTRGEYAGYAVFRPHHKRDLKEGLFEVIGRTVELEFAGVADPDEPFAGQNLYQERRGELLQHSWVPEEDLEFVTP